MVGNALIDNKSISRLFRKKKSKEFNPSFVAKKIFELTCNFYTVSGWKEHSSQQKPMKPGMAKNKLKDILK